MKVHIEWIEGLPEDEVIIRCGRVDERMQRIQRYILDQSKQVSEMVFYKGNQEFYFPLEQVLFFETEGDYIFAHTAKDEYKIHYRLIELNEILPRYFIRTSKSAIVNTLQIYSITRSITASSLIQFKDSHKHIYVSRHYYNDLRNRLNERSNV